MEAPEFSGLAS